MPQVSGDGAAFWGVVAASGNDAEIEKVTDSMKITGNGVFGIPTIVVGGKVKSVGNILKREEIKSRIVKGAHVLYEDIKAVHELEHFFERVVKENGESS